jgi:DnaJ-class molecular chaperone
MSADLYNVLGIRRDATPAEITAAYRRLALALHPDSGADTSDTRVLQDVIAAYRVLSDPERRRDYDRTLAQTIVSTSGTPCGVCRGSRSVRIPCPRCAGAGFSLMSTPWLKTPAQCPACSGNGYMRTRCGACAARGLTTRS